MFSTLNDDKDIYSNTYICKLRVRSTKIMEYNIIYERDRIYNSILIENTLYNNSMYVSMYGIENLAINYYIDVEITYLKL